jgi:hypothetical protein
VIKRELNLPVFNISSKDTDKGRIYETPDGNFPSITTILGGSKDNSFLDEWRKRIGVDAADLITSNACSVGTEMHMLLEHYIKEDISTEELSNKAKTCSSKGQVFYRFIKPLVDRTLSHWCASEVPMWSKELGIAGRSDLIGVIKEYDALTVADYKSNSNITRKKENNEVEDYKIQVSAYAKMFEETYGHRVPYGVILMTNGMINQKWVFETEEYLDKLKERIVIYHKNLTN